MNDELIAWYWEIQHRVAAGRSLAETPEEVERLIRLCDALNEIRPAEEVLAELLADTADLDPEQFEAYARASARDNIAQP